MYKLSVLLFTLTQMIILMYSYPYLVVAAGLTDAIAFNHHVMFYTKPVADLGYDMFSLLCKILIRY